MWCGGKSTGFALPIYQVLVTRRNVQNGYSVLQSGGVWVNFLMHADMIVNSLRLFFCDNDNHSQFWGSTNVLLKK